jgi:hypothetical protein
MRIGRDVIPAILALSFAGSALMGAAASAVAATYAPGAGSHAVISAQVSSVYYRG